MDLHFILMQIALPAAIALLLGWVVKTFVLKYLLRLTHKTAWKSDDLIISAISKYVILWFILLACLYILPHLKLNKELPVHLKNSILAAYILTITIAIAKILGGITTISSSRKDSNIPDSSILSNIVKVVVYILGFVLILQQFKIQITPIITALGVGGLAVALALQETLSNLFAGIQIIAGGKTNIGDFIELENGKKGTITDITWRNTTIETVTNNIIVIPNSTLNRSIVENFIIENQNILHYIEVGVAYGSDLDLVEKVSIEEANWVANNIPGAISDFNNHVRFIEFGDSSINLRIYFQVEEYKYRLPVSSELIRRVHNRYRAEGINIPFPIRTIIQQG